MLPGPDTRLGGEPLFKATPILQSLDTAFHIIKQNNKKYTAMMSASFPVV